MKLYRVKASKYSCEQDISIVIIANSKERALEIAKDGNKYDWKNPNKDKFYWDFNEDQFPLIVDEINLDLEQVVDVSNC